MKVRVGGAWVDPQALKVRQGGAWATPTGLKVRQGGAWVDVPIPGSAPVRQNLVPLYDTQSFEGPAFAWAPHTGTVSVERSQDRVLDGAWSLKVIPTGSGNSFVHGPVQGAGAPVVAGQTYTMMALVALTEVANKACQFQVQTWNSGGSGTGSVNNGWSNQANQAGSFIRFVFTAPASAARASAIIVLGDAPTQPWYVDKYGIFEGDVPLNEFAYSGV